MKFLITGASGFLGQGLAGRLAGDGHTVVLLGRSVLKEEGSSISSFQADITDMNSLRDCQIKHPDIDTVVHMAALVPKTKEEDRALNMCAVNVEGTLNVLEVFGENLKNFVYASTAEIYGLPEANGPIAESMLPVPLSNYGASKLAGELFARVYGQQHGTPIASLRFTVMYGPGDTINRAVPNFIKRALMGENLEVYGGEEMRDYLHVSDAIEAIYSAATKQVDGTFNIGTGQGITIKDTAEKIIQAINPRLSVSILSREKKASDIVLNVTKAREQLGFEAKHIFPDLLSEQIAWHKQQI